jgi:hypothetical protein
MGGSNTCFSQVLQLSKVNICVECVPESVTELKNFYPKSLSPFFYFYLFIFFYWQTVTFPFNFTITLSTTICSPGQYSSEYLEFRWPYMCVIS